MIFNEYTLQLALEQFREMPLLLLFIIPIILAAVAENMAMKHKLHGFFWGLCFGPLGIIIVQLIILNSKFLTNK